ncbi:MAG: transglycosylase SLT domain-containing protein [Roseiarcus sp.]
MAGARVLTPLIAACALSWAAASQEGAPPAPPADPHAREAKLDFTPVSRIGAEPAPGANLVAPAEAPADRPADLSRLLAAAQLYQKGDLAGGDALAIAVNDPLQRLALEWIALKSTPHPDKDRLAAFAATHPDWPAKAWFRAFQEAALYNDHPRPEAVVAFFTDDPPRTPSGKLALARALQASHPDQAAALARGLWRDSDLDGWGERAVLGEFAGMLTRADHRFRAERLLYAGNVGPAMRAAALAGADELALAKLWASAIARPLAPEAFDAAPASMKADPALLYLRIQALRRADRVLEAALLLRHAPRDAAALIDGDRWWDERRWVARRLLDAGMAWDAYELCAEHSAVSIPSRVDAEFHAGWIALRFLGDAQTAAGRFAAAAAIAQTPLAIARTAYWQGRAAEQAARDDEARRFYERAAAFPIAYYGQLAAQKLHAPALALRAPSRVATGEARNEATRVVALLYAAKLDGPARALAFDAARAYRDEAQLAALAQVVQSQRDGLASVAIGKLATERGFALDESAFPTFGVPGFAPLNNSADLTMVYSVARQESEFADHAASGAGAKGLMQILPSTARETASRAGVPFDAARLVADPVYNVELGAAYLGRLLLDEGGSALLALAAYNAGGGRVQQWIDAYGDPRAAGVDPVDWVESIPFDETRDYVQRVYENLQVYGARFRDAGKAPVEPQTGRVARADF